MQHAVAAKILAVAVHVVEDRLFRMNAIWRVQITQTPIEASGNDFPSATRNDGTVAHFHVGFEG